MKKYFLVPVSEGNAIVCPIVIYKFDLEKAKEQDNVKGLIEDYVGIATRALENAIEKWYREQAREEEK